VIRTRAGYTGGLKENPTYRALGDHSESMEISYDPSVISYLELLEIFWKSHDPGVYSRSKQYMSAIFYHNDEQKKLAIESRQREEAARHQKIYTEILPAARFYPAEDYHQKYFLRQRPDLVNELRVIYPGETFVDSTAAARLNGFLAGHGSYHSLEAELRDQIPPDEKVRLLKILSGNGR